MDLNQRKMNKTEWISIEVPISKQEKDVLTMIIQGYQNVNIRMNNHLSLFTFLKMEYTEKIEDFLFQKFLRSSCDEIETKMAELVPNYKRRNITSIVKLNSIDRLRLNRFDTNPLNKDEVYDYVLLQCLEKMVASKKDTEFHHYYFTLYSLVQNNVALVNRHLVDIIHTALMILQDKIDLFVLLQNSCHLLEKNKLLLKYDDLKLYEHQKKIFTVMKQPGPKLVLYIAPTGTGKTLTPIALSETNKIIFVCAARHVGLALAKSAISMQKKVAFAFGCSSADDIRLHYYAAKEFTRNKRSGGVGKVDNSVGDNVEIMICDIRSYVYAMYYMMAFFPPENIILYWDEPTITMDYTDHAFHKTIRRNWKQNQIPNVVLSSATLPKLKEWTETVPDFLSRFAGAEICEIVSHECRKSIPLLNKDGYVVLPHTLEEDFDKMKEIVSHCLENATLLRYFDLKEVVTFIEYMNTKITTTQSYRRYFDSVKDITMQNIKMYYLQLLHTMTREEWTNVYSHFQSVQQPRIVENTRVDTKGNPITKIQSLSSLSSYKLGGTPITKLASEHYVYKDDKHTTTAGTSGVYVTTKDAYTLTDGPTIFITNDVEKVAKFCIQQANIPDVVMDDIMKKIEFNNVVNEKLWELESALEVWKETVDKKAKNEVSAFHEGWKVNGRNKGQKTNKLNKDIPENKQMNNACAKLTQEIDACRAIIKSVMLNDIFVPNKKPHLDKWAPPLGMAIPFTSTMDEETVCDIMALKHVDDKWKILLMMGIGVFMNHENITYMEIMKKLADQQKLYMIIATSDYIYGTNYQFCHCFLSKDLDLTQEKIIQAMGRVGRNNIQHTYTIRFRDNRSIYTLFSQHADKPEIVNLNRLFNSKKVVWQNGEYIEVEEGEEEDTDAFIDDIDVKEVFTPYQEEEDTIHEDGEYSPHA